MADWRYIVTDLAGVELIELWNARGTNHAAPLNGVRTVTGSIDLEHPAADLLAADAPAEQLRLLLKAYRNGERFLVGPFTDAEETAGPDGVGSVSFTAASPLARLLGRLIGKSTAGYGDGTPLATKDLGQIARGLIEAANAERDTGVRIGAIGASSSSYLERVYFKRIAELIAELGPGNLGGYDFDLEPVEPVADGLGVKLATFNTYGSKGQHRPNVVLEYGTGKRNVQSYRRPISGSGRVTRAYSLAVGFPDAIAEGDTPVVSTIANDAEGAGERFEDVVGNGDLGVVDLRQRQTAEHVAIRKHPRNQWLVTPAPATEYEYGVDFEEGDTITARIVNPHTGRVRLNGIVRIYGVELARDDMGRETLELNLVPDAA